MRQAVLDHVPSGLGLSGRLWSRGPMGEPIFTLYRVRSTEPGTGKYLRRWGLTFQRPDKRAVEQGAEAVRTRGEQGRTPVVRRTGNRFSVHATSAISTKGRMHFMVFTETFDAKVVCRFPGRLVGHFDRKMHLIVDRRSAHRSKTVRAWPADNSERLRRGSWCRLLSLWRTAKTSAG